MIRRKGLSFGSVVNSYISRYPGLEYTGTAIRCIYCNANIACWNSNQCKRHVQSKKHIANRVNNVPYWKFMYDFVYTMNVCNIPHNLVDNVHFRLFWEKYVNSWKLLKRRQLQYQLPRVKSMVEGNIKTELKDKKVWLTVDTTKDSKHFIVSVLVRVLKPEGPSSPYLLCSKRLRNVNGKVVSQLVHDCAQKYDIMQDNFLMLITDGSTPMLEAGTFLKEHFSNLLHITCLIHTLHLVAKTIRDNYSSISTLIMQTKISFSTRDRTKETKEFRELLPGVPPPPQPSATKAATWIEAATYYHKHFKQFQSVALNSDLKLPKAFQDCRQLFTDPEVEEDLKIIAENYSIIVEAIKQLQNSSLSLAESLDIVDSVRTVLDSLSYNSALQAAMMFRTILNENPDFDKLWCISKCKCEPEDPEYFFKQYFQYANITSLDGDRLLSKHTSALSSAQKPLTESTMEGFLMVQVYSTNRPSSLEHKA